MTKKVLLLHAYSNSNAGDGLLVRLALVAIKNAFGERVDITVCATHPQSFKFEGVRVVDAKPTLTGYKVEFLRTIARVRSFDIVVGVGGGYLRGGTALELLKTLLAHGPQLLAAAVANKCVVYLPQSIGPLRFGSRWFFRFLLGRLSHVCVRDDRSVIEIALPNVSREPDMGISFHGPRLSAFAPVEQTPVFSVRWVHGVLPHGLTKLAGMVPKFHVYVQSAYSGNNDVLATEELGDHVQLSKDLFLNADGPRRVVVAVRLHAALMALHAGHFVIHLAYERKGFGAFADLGLEDYVYNVNSFCCETVHRQLTELMTCADARRRYVENVERRTTERAAAFDRIVAALRFPAKSDAAVS